MVTVDFNENALFFEHTVSEERIHNFLNCKLYAFMIALKW